jgi:hypothetical protein
VRRASFYVYNTLEKISEVWYTKNDSSQLAYSYTYTDSGALKSFKNCLTGEITEITYDYSSWRRYYLPADL